MAALRRIRLQPNPPTGQFQVEYQDTRRPNRRVIEVYDEEHDVTVAEAARILDVSTRSIYNWIEDGDLETVPGSSPLMIPIAEVREVLREQYEDDHEFDEDDLEEESEDGSDEDDFDDDDEGEEWDDDDEF